MEAMITTVAELYQKLSFIDSFVFFLYCLIGSAIYFFFRVYMPQRLKEREAETKNEQPLPFLLSWHLYPYLVVTTGLPQIGQVSSVFSEVNCGFGADSSDGIALSFS